MTEKEIDRIKKLISVANGTANDNESNLAARMVCKLLKDYNFSFIPPGFRPFPAQERYYSSRESQAYQAPPRPKPQPQEDRRTYSESHYKVVWDEADFFTKHQYDDLFDSIFGRRSGKTKAQQEQAKSYYNPNTDKYEPINKTSNEIRKVKCAKCNEVKETRFQGDDSLWVCMDCRGKEYQTVPDPKTFTFACQSCKMPTHYSHSIRNEWVFVCKSCFKSTKITPPKP